VPPMSVSEKAGRLPDPADLVDVDALIGAYYDEHPDPADATQRVAFGTSGHRGTSTAGTFNEAHVLAVTEAICRYRAQQGIDGPLYLGRDTHALSEPAARTIVEVLAAHEIDVMVDQDDAHRLRARGQRCLPPASPESAPTVHRHAYVSAYVDDLPAVIDLGKGERRRVVCVHDGIEEHTVVGEHSPQRGAEPVGRQPPEVGHALPQPGDRARRVERAAAGVRAQLLVALEHQVVQRLAAHEDEVVAGPAHEAATTLQCRP
jgi:hypothetical protein